MAFPVCGLILGACPAPLVPRNQGALHLKGRTSQGCLVRQLLLWTEETRSPLDGLIVAPGNGTPCIFFLMSDVLRDECPPDRSRAQLPVKTPGSKPWQWVWQHPKLLRVHFAAIDAMAVCISRRPILVMRSSRHFLVFEATDMTERKRDRDSDCSELFESHSHTKG